MPCTGGQEADDVNEAEGCFVPRLVPRTRVGVDTVVGMVRIGDTVEVLWLRDQTGLRTERRCDDDGHAGAAEVQ